MSAPVDPNPSPANSSPASDPSAPAAAASTGAAPAIAAPTVAAPAITRGAAPPVGIGMPVYNGATFLPDALASLADQTFADYEIVITDNASTDATEAICREHARRDERIRYVRQPENLGAVPNFNRAFELTRSPLFKWAAHDDLCAPTYLERTVAVLRDDPHAAWSHSRSSHIDDRGRLLDEPDALDVSYAAREAPGAAERFRAVLLDPQGCLDSYGVIRSDLLRRTPLYISAYGAEKIVMAELALMGRYREVPETLFHVRVSAGGSGNLSGAEAQQAFIDTRRPPDRMVRLKLLRAYLDAISRSAPTPAEAMRCRAALLRWMLQVGKWRRVALAALRGEGLGGRNRGRVERIEQRRAGAHDSRAHEARARDDAEPDAAR